MKRPVIIIVFLILISQALGCISIYHYVENKRNRSYIEGINLYKQRKYEDALDKFEYVIDVEPKYKSAKRYYDKTNRILKRKERRIKARANALYTKGLQQMNRRRYESALTYLLLAEKKDPDHPDVEDKIDECREKLEPKFKSTAKYAERLFKRRQYKKAYQTALRAERYKPGAMSSLKSDISNKLEDKSDPYRDRAENFYDKKQYKAAKQQLTVALRLNPWDEDARELMKKTNERIYLDKNYLEAVNFFNRQRYFISKGKFNWVNRVEPGYKSTTRYLERIKSILTRRIGSYYSTGVSYYQRGNYGAAISEFNKVLSINPNHSNAREYRQRAQTKQQIKQSLGG